MLSEEGADLVVADTNPLALDELCALVPFEGVPPAEILDVDCDLFAPCAVGGVIDATGARRLRAKAVAGSANNVLRSKEAGAVLFSRGIAYAPDYLVNAGALIQGIRFLREGERSSPVALAAIGEKTGSLLARSRERGIPPEGLLEEETRERLGGGRGWRGWFSA
jgi:leucine dehydrogenase